MDQSLIETFHGVGRLLAVTGEEIAPIRYEYRIDRKNRVWSGTAVRTDISGPLPVAAGPGQLETDRGERAPVHFRHRRDGDGNVIIVFTGRGAPPGE
ncbi:MAG TPA: hypothetical protein VFS96_00870 [Nitrolancea sp.]|nr:hypothetical protein [Nitrolancea sp.]